MIPVDKVKETLDADTNHDIAVVYCCHHETGTGVLNPIRDIGALAHAHGCTMIADTTSSYAMVPIDLRKDNVDFTMASAQKGIMFMTGLSFVIGKTAIMEESKKYPTRSYYTNLYMQYSFIRDKGEMHFTPPVQVIYSSLQAIKEYFAEGEEAKWERHQAVWKELVKGAEEFGFKPLINLKYQSHLVLALQYPDDLNFGFEKMHDLLYAKGFTIYPGKVSDFKTFRLCSLGAIFPADIVDFWKAMKDVLAEMKVAVSIQYND